jgi:hypothetical protein
MSIIVFTGPTLPADAARRELDAIYLPPVSQGDVYRACAKRPKAIAIIDGYFERVPSVWHKEILWAMSQGIHVFGSSSMGALRAAELHAFGMIGVGAVFEAFRDGVLEDDDEVAVAHGPAESGFRAGSEAMVNIRRTFEAASHAGILHESTHAAMLDIAKRLYYPERVYPVILDAALQQGLPADEIAALRAFLKDGRINQKRDDAMLLLRTLRSLADTGLEAKVVDFKFETTEFWCRAQRTAGEFGAAEHTGAPYEALAFEGILDELRLDPSAYRRAMSGAMLRHLELLEAERLGITVDSETLERASDAFRRQRGLYQPDDVEAWMREFNLDWGAFARLLRDEALCGWVEKANAEVAQGRVRDQLTLSGEYAQLVARARSKQQSLEQLGAANPTLSATSMTEADLVRWYFDSCAGVPTPTNAAAALRAAGFVDLDEFRRVALREHIYRGLVGPTHAASSSA